ncbi:unnamed protein product [Discosporangium mesarthrocarpum]
MADLRRSETAADLMQFLQVVNWLRVHLPRLVEIVHPFRELLKEHMAGAPRRMKRVASHRRLQMLMFPDASDHHWGCFLTQIPIGELQGNRALVDMRHEPLDFLSRSFRGAQLR